ncbi:hypothetical protein STEG23_025388, partial [Scotinomys teguina]
FFLLKIILHMNGPLLLLMVVPCNKNSIWGLVRWLKGSGVINWTDPDITNVTKHNFDQCLKNRWFDGMILHIQFPQTPSDSKSQ